MLCTKRPHIFAGFAAFLMVIACALAFASTTPADAPHISTADDNRAFCLQFMDNLAYRVTASAYRGTPRDAWRVVNGPEYVNEAVTAFVYAIYDGKFPAATVLYDSAVAACIRYRMESDA